MTLILALVLGAALGWIGAVVLHENALRQIAGMMLLGALGAWLGGLLLAPTVGSGSMMGWGLSPPNLLLSLLGSFLVLGTVGVLRRRFG